MLVCRVVVVNRPLRGFPSVYFSYSTEINLNKYYKLSVYNTYFNYLILIDSIVAPTFVFNATISEHVTYSKRLKKYD
jgi:hypothetical protein